MTSEMEWTKETYRLDEIEGEFSFPCVVYVNEGYYSNTDAEGFSQGEILSIDSKLALQKVAANFAKNVEEDIEECNEYVELKNEILVPLNYKGKLNVLRPIKNYESVRELATDFPKYAYVKENLNVATEDNSQVIIWAGTKIELDRIIPGSALCPNPEQDKLVIKFEHLSRRLIVAVPLNARGKFRTVPDEKKYTIKEATDRYSLPQFVRFVDDTIKRVYTQDLLEGIDNMITRTETLRLNRMVTQNVLVGHCKPLDASKTKDTERFRQRTLVVLPMDNPDICDIKVNVLKGDTDEVYERIFLVRNVSNSDTEEFVDGSLYVDFAMTPRIKILPHDENTSGSEDTPPPRPPKPSSLAPAVGPKPRSRRVLTKKPALETTNTSDSVVAAAAANVSDSRTDQTKLQSLSGEKHSAEIKPFNESIEEDHGCYEEMTSPVATSPLPRTSPGNGSGFSLADLDFTSVDVAKGNALKKRFSFSKIKNTLKVLKWPKENKAPKSANESLGQSDEKAANSKEIETQVSSEDEEEIPGLYDEINELEMSENPNLQSQASFKGEPEKDTYMRTIKYHENPVKPTARVHPSSVTPQEKRKLFKNLNNEELVERLQLCGLTDMAKLCETANLNGSFFENITTKILQEDMNLNGIELHKFVQMRDANWVPNTKK